MKHLISFFSLNKFSFIFIALLYLALQLLQAQPCSKNLNKVIDLVNKEVNERKYKKYEKILEKYIIKCPKNDDLYISLSLLQNSIDSIQKAIRTIEKGLLEIPNSSKLIDQKIVILMNLIKGENKTDQRLVELFCDELISLKKNMTKESLCDVLKIKLRILHEKITNIESLPVTINTCAQVISFNEEILRLIEMCPTYNSLTKYNEVIFMKSIKLAELQTIKKNYIEAQIQLNKAYSIGGALGNFYLVKYYEQVLLTAKAKGDVANERMALQELIRLKVNVSIYTKDLCTNNLRQIIEEIKNKNFISAIQYFENTKSFCSDEHNLKEIEMDLYLNYAKYLAEEMPLTDLNLNQSLSIINFFIEKFPENAISVANLKKVIYEKLINSSLRENLFLKAIEYCNQMSILFPSDSVSFNVINNIANSVLNSEETGPKDWNQIIFLTNKILSTSKESAIRANAKAIVRKSNIKIALYLKTENCYTEAIEILNKMLLEAPDDEEVKQIRAEIYFLLGDILYKKREYDLAYNCYKIVAKEQNYIGLKGLAAIASMFDRIQIHDSTLYYLLKIVQSPYLPSYKRNELRYKCAQIYAKQNRPYDSMVMLKEIQKTNEYDLYRKKAKNDNSFYNLDNSKAFHLWADAKAGVRISNFRGTINYNPDKGKIFDWGDVKGPDLYLKVSKGGFYILKTETQWGNFSPAWGEGSEYVIDKNWNESIDLSIEIWDDDAGAPFRRNKHQGTAYFRINSFGNITPYQILPSENTPSGGRLTLSLSSTETLDPPYTYYKYYHEPPVFKIGLSLSTCLLKKFVSIGPFVMITLAEGVLFENLPEKTEEAVIGVAKKILYKTFIPKPFLELMRINGIFRCIINAAEEMEKAGWKNLPLEQTIRV